MFTILLVDDDEDLREALAETLLATDRYDVLEAATWHDGKARALDSRFDMAVLDVSLPDGDGRDLARWMRQEGMRQPIVMLTGNATEADEVAGMKAGANDYITKPFSADRLLARLEAHALHHARSDAADFAIGDRVFEAGPRLVRLPNGAAVRLTDKEVGILRFLASAPGRRGEREALLSEVWGYKNAVSTHTLETHIYRLRQKIEDNPSQPVLLRTDPGGYSLSL